MVAVMLRGAVGEKPMPGNKIHNHEDDVRRVHALLNAAFGRAIAPSSGKCEAGTIKAIREFQKLWGSDDGSVWPGGKTLTQLNRMVTPLVLKPITLGRIRQGGYVIGYATGDKKELPNDGYTIELCVGSDAATLDVTGRKASDLIGPDNVEDLLDLIEKTGRWGEMVHCWLKVKFGANVVTQSNKQPLTTPVKPYGGELGAALLDEANVGDWTYGATDAKGTDGRYLWVEPINGNYYFAYGGKFETKKTLRGLVCITYIGAVYSVGADASVKNTWGAKVSDKGSVNVMAAYGTQLAVHLGAKPVNMEAKKEKEITAFFSEHTTGHYMMWKEGHTVLVVDGEVHEFTNRNGTAKGHYQWDAVNEKDATKQYPYGNSTWWIRELSPP
jgi:hypothetical protein